jgi:hypothetical protein
MRKFTQICYSSSRTKLLTTGFYIVDIRAKGTEERTRDYVLEGMKRVQDAFLHENLIANVRLETYEGSRVFPCPATPWETVRIILKPTPCPFHSVYIIVVHPTP